AARYELGIAAQLEPSLRSVRCDPPIVAGDEHGRERARGAAGKIEQQRGGVVHVDLGRQSTLLRAGIYTGHLARHANHAVEGMDAARGHAAARSLQPSRAPVAGLETVSGRARVLAFDVEERADRTGL